MDKYALVLEGGGMRGAYTAGALAWLQDHGITFDYSVGISSGALYLISFLTGNERLPKNLSTQYVCDPGAIGFKALIHEGHYVAYNKLFSILKEKEGLNVRELKELNPNMEIGVYDLAKGETVFFGPKELDDDMNLLLASCALPIASARVSYEGKEYMDGGIAKMIPIERSIEKGNTKHLVITTKPEGYVRKPAGFIMRTMMSMFYGDYPKEVEDYKIRHLNYEKQMKLIQDLVDEGDALMIRPSKTIKVSRFNGNPEDLNRLYNLGYEDMEARKEEVLSFMKGKEKDETGSL